MSSSLARSRLAPASIARERERYPLLICFGLMALISAALWWGLTATVRWLLPWH